MMVTMEQIKKIKEAYKHNKEELKDLKQYIEDNGITDDGLSDVTTSFEQGWNNAMEYVSSVLGVDFNTTIKELKQSVGYEFECNMSNEYKEYYKKYDSYDEWGCAFVWLGENIGAEYNFAIETYNDEVYSACAIYKTKINNETGYMNTDYDTYIHYDIDFNNENWEEELENAMCKATIEFFNL